MDFGVWQRLMRLKKAYLLHQDNLHSNFEDVDQDFKLIEKSQYSYIYRHKGGLIFVSDNTAEECDGYIYMDNKSSQFTEVFHYSAVDQAFKIVIIDYNEDGTLYSCTTKIYNDDESQKYTEYFDTGTTIEDLLE